MKIAELEGHILRAPDEGRPHWVSHFVVPRANEILVRMRTDEGLEGIGLATSYTPIVRRAGQHAALQAPPCRRRRSAGALVAAVVVGAPVVTVAPGESGVK